MKYSFRTIIFQKYLLSGYWIRLEPNVAHSLKIPDFTIWDNWLHDIEGNGFPLTLEANIMIRIEFSISDISMGQNVWECGHGYNKIQETDIVTAQWGEEQSPECQSTCFAPVPSVDGNRHSHLLHRSLPFLPSQESQESLECDSDLRKGFQLWNFLSQDRHFLLSVFPAPFSLYPQLIPPQQFNCASGWQNKKWSE